MQGQNQKAEPKQRSVRLVVDRMLHQLERGQKLPDEVSLARELDCSRNTLREALRPYMEQGVLVRRRGAGTWLVRHPGRPIGPTIEVWTTGAGVKRPDRLAHWDELLDTGPDVRFVEQDNGSADWLDAVTLAHGGMRCGDRPALMMIEGPHLVEHARHGTLVDLTETIERLPDYADIEPWALDLASHRGRVYAVPYKADAYGMWISRQALAEADLPPTWRPNSWAAWTEALTILHQATGKALAVPPTSTAIDLLGTLAAMAGATLQHDEPPAGQKKPGFPTPTREASNRAVIEACRWLVAAREAGLLDPRLTFGRTPWDRLLEGAFGFFHGTQAPMSLAAGKPPALEDYVFWPVPPRTPRLQAAYPLKVLGAAVNRSLGADEREAAMRYVNLVVSPKVLNRRMAQKGVVFLARASCMQQPEAPAWLRDLEPAWRQLVARGVRRLSSPLGMNPREVTEMLARCLQGEAEPWLGSLPQVR